MWLEAQLSVATKPHEPPNKIVSLFCCFDGESVVGRGCLPTSSPSFSFVPRETKQGAPPKIRGPISVVSIMRITTM